MPKPKKSSSKKSKVVPKGEEMIAFSPSDTPDGEHEPSCSCVAHFLSPFLQRAMPAEFGAQMRSEGLDVSGRVASGFSPVGYVFGAADPEVSFGASDPSAAWGGGGGRGATVSVGFLDRNPKAEEKIHEYVKRWTDAADITFKFGVNPASAQIRITFAQKGAFFSLLGREAENTRAPRETMSLGFTGREPESEYRRLILHEFGHAIGFHHEHRNPVEGIPFDPPKAIAYYKQRLPQGMSDQDIWGQLAALPNSSRYKFSAFDPKSIMLYSVPESIVKSGTYRREWGNHNTELSDTDLSMVADLYGPGPNPITPPKTEPKVRKLSIDGSPLTDSITTGGEVDKFTFTVKTTGVYRVETDGDAIVHIDVADENEKRIPDYKGADSISPNRGVRMPCWLPAATYTLLVTASEFLPTTRGEYTIRVVSE
jgi:serralysin